MRAYIPLRQQVDRNWAIQNIMSKNKETAGGLLDHDSIPLSVDRPDSEASLTSGDKSMEESIGDITEFGTELETQVEMEVDITETVEKASPIQPLQVELNYMESTVTNGEIVEAVRSENQFANKVNKCFSLISESLSYTLTELSTQALLLDCRRWVCGLKTKLAKVRRVYARLPPAWLARHFRLSKEVLQHPTQCVPDSSPTTINWEDQQPSTSATATAVSKTSMHRRMHKAAADLDPFSPKKLISIATKATKKKGLKEVSSLLRISKTSPGRPKKILNAYHRYQRSKAREPYTASDALALVLDLNLTKDQYMKIRNGAKSHGFNLYPAYNKVRNEKSKCRPAKEDLVVSETKACVSMQSLLDHTSSRIIELQSETVCQIYDRYGLSEATATLFCSYGFDGSTGQSNYKQRFEACRDPKYDDSSLFATTVIPLRIVMENGALIWQNRTPQSPRFCRPLKLEFVKESRELIQSENLALESEIAQLLEKTISLGSDPSESNIKIKYDMRMTVIDGKVLSAVLGVSSALVCPLCLAKPSTFNNLIDVETRFKPLPDRLNYGISPLHAWIRCLEFCLHLSYRLEFKQWQARGSALQTMVATRKKSIQQQLIERMGLRVDFPKPGGSGTSNDGNTARRAFQDPLSFSEILGLEFRLVKDLGTILIALNSQFPINTAKFKLFCFELATWYVSKYNWFPMPVSVHKILIPGSDIIGESILPIGMYGEEAGESKNKFYKQDRLHHSRKFSRLATMTDMFNRSMDTSDPVLSTKMLSDRENSRKRKSLPLDVISLLESSSAPVSLATTLEDDFDDLEEREGEVTIALLDEIVLDNEGLVFDDDVR